MSLHERDVGDSHVLERDEVLQQRPAHRAQPVQRQPSEKQGANKLSSTCVRVRVTTKVSRESLLCHLHLR